MPKNIKCKNCNNLKNHWCERIIDSPDEDMERDCQYFWLKTNADRIRAMTDEELEPMILAFKLGYSPWCDYHCENEGDYGCDTCILKWLKQPAEVDNG